MHDVLSIGPFAFLSAGARARLLDALTWQSWPAGKVIVRQGDLSDDRVFLLAEGTVDLIDHHRGPDTRVDQIGPGNYFGERPALFGIPRVLEVRAATDCETACMDGELFVALLRSEPHMAHALRFILRDKQHLFDAFERFLAEVQQAASRGVIVVNKILHAYRQLTPALHRHPDGDRIDLGALSYVVRRLPDDVTRTFVWFCTDVMPPELVASRGSFRDTTAPARRRVTWELMPGKGLILLRDGLSDLLDLVTCLCVFAVEARKIRRQLARNGVLPALTGPDADAALERTFSAPELAVLRGLWDDLPRTLLHVALHHEDVTLHVDRVRDNYNTNHAETWTQQIVRGTRELLGRDPHSLPEDFEVHVVSSNTHSVTNCLSPWLWENAATIRAWGRQHAPELHDLPWGDPSDQLVALLRPYLAAHPEAEAARRQRDAGVAVRLDETAFTGIAVQLFHLGALGDATLDPALPCTRRPGLVVNVDYAFGQQAEAIVANLVNLFGRRIRSINVLGKAGGLRGARGDVFVATGFVNQVDDVLLVAPPHVDIERLRGRLHGRGLHVGRVLTVLGTVLQNDRLLHYYDKLWDCVGLEMEGSWYGRQALECRELGMLAPDVALRFLYYTSDLPLQHDATLSAGMTPFEGIPPLYATTREVLASILA